MTAQTPLTSKFPPQLSDGHDHMYEQGLLRALGVRIRRLADLEEGAVYIADRSLLLLDIELSDCQIRRAIESVLPSVRIPTAGSSTPRQ